MTTFTIITLGCKVNQAESEELRKRLLAGDWIPAAAGQAADLCVVHTCAVTQRAAMQSRQALRRAVAENPGARVVATGCYAATDPQAVERITGLDGIARRPADAVADDPPDSKPSRHAAGAADESAFQFQAPTLEAAGRTRPAVKIQDGCDASCAYCIVPRARGASRSMSPSRVLEAVTRTFAAGFREVVLTGIHLGSWGRDLDPPRRLEDLLAAIARSDLPGRVRLSSIEPLELSDALIDLVASSERFCRHFHIPLQSGDARVLRRMRRPYTPDEFARRIERLHAAVPDAAIGTDLIVGFPGETEAAFAQTRRMVAALPLAYLHVFPFSPRPGTAAWDLAPRVDPAEIKRRSETLRRLGREKRLAFHREFIGREVEVLVEGRRDPATGRLKGITSNYLAVLFDGGDRLRTTLARVRILDADPVRLSGALVRGAA